MRFYLLYIFKTVKYTSLALKNAILGCLHLFRLLPQRPFFCLLFDPATHLFTCLYWLYSIKYKILVFWFKAWRTVFTRPNVSQSVLRHGLFCDGSVTPSSTIHLLRSQVSIFFPPPLVSHVWEEFSLTSEKLLHYSAPAFSLRFPLWYL